MTNDQRMAALLNECLAELDLQTDAADEAARAVLRRIEAASPGELRAIADRLEQRRLRTATRH